MAPTSSPSPNSSPTAASPTSAVSPPAPPTSSTSPSNSFAVPPSTTSQPDQTTETPAASSPSNSSAPPPSASTVPATRPPSPTVSPPPTSPPPSVPSAPPPSLPASPPPTTVASPPPSPPLLPPPSNPATPPPSQTTPPPTKTSPPPQVSSQPVIGSPPPQGSSQPVIGSPPPHSSTAPPASSAPPPQAVSPAVSSPPVNPATPPTPGRNPPEKSSPPASTTPPASSGSQPSSSPPSTDSPPGPALPSSPPSIPSTTSPPSIAPPGPPSDSKLPGSPPLSPLPNIPTEKPTAKSTDGTHISSNDSSTHKGGLNTGGGVAIGVAVGFVMLSLVMAVWFINKQKRRRIGSRVGHPLSSPAASSQNSDTLFLKSRSPAPFYGSASGSELMYSPSEQGGMGNSKAWFPYEELVQATNGFSAQNLLGEGGFGCVYKGLLADGRVVAVKQLKIGGGQGEREFRAEVEIISRVHHRHLVSLVGYCISEHQRLLVYEYVPNNTLHNHLHGVDRPVMSWGTRVRVAAGSARGIAYLHEDCHPRIIHRDIKSSNILLDNNFEARVSDFGLAKLALDSNTHVTTRVIGTFGYMAPEYATSGKLTEKSDVYSFGVVLLELITGRKPVDVSQPIGDESLVEWARPLLTGALENEDFEGLVDPRLENNYDPREMFRMIEAAAACVRHSSTKRPRMSQVVRALESLHEMSDLTNGMRPGQSEIFNSAEQSAQIRMFHRMAFGSQDYSSSFFNESQSSWRSRNQGDSNTFPLNNGSGNV